MLRSNEVILILLLVFLRRRIAYQISPVITEICWLLLAMRLLLPEAISVKLNVLGQQKTAQMEFKSLFVGWRWIGCSILCIATVCMTASFYWKLRGKMLCTENKVNAWKREHPLRLPYQVYRTSAVSTPISCGLLCPQIVLPDMNYSESEKNFILLHEWAHLRRGDLWKKRLLLLATFWNWYHPIAWVMLFFANRDIELCCDRFVTRTLTRKQKQDYARFLVEFQTYVKLPQTGFTGGQLQERIVNLMMKPQKNNWSMLAVSLTLLTLCIVSACIRLVPQVEYIPSAQRQDNYEEAKEVMRKVNRDSEEIYNRLENGEKVVIELDDGKMAVLKNDMEEK